jgi:hypothetical protein
MKLLRILVVVMGVMIVGGTVTLGVLLARRVSGPSATPVAALPATAVATLLDEPAGTRIASVSSGSDNLTVQLQGGGPDRVVVMDIRSGRITARLGLAH